MSIFNQLQRSKFYALLNIKTGEVVDVEYGHEFHLDKLKTLYKNHKDYKKINSLNFWKIYRKDGWVRVRGLITLKKDVDVQGIRSNDTKLIEIPADRVFDNETKRYLQKIVDKDERNFKLNNIDGFYIDDEDEIIGIDSMWENSDTFISTLDDIIESKSVRRVRISTILKHELEPTLELLRSGDIENYMKIVGYKLKSLGIAILRKPSLVSLSIVLQQISKELLESVFYAKFSLNVLKRIIILSEMRMDTVKEKSSEKEFVDSYFKKAVAIIKDRI